jgi:hypothetical protein
MGWMNWAKYGTLPLLLGVLFGAAVLDWSHNEYWGKIEPQPSYPVAAIYNGVGTDTQIPYWSGFLSRPLEERYPLYYCLDGAGWSQDDHYAAWDGLDSDWGWGKINRTIAVQIQERCDEKARVTVIFKMDSAFVQNYCQPNAGFTVVACVSFDGWKYVKDADLWEYSTAIVHVEPYYWARLDHNWREHVLIHEFGHAGLALWDTPAQACGTTVMDYTYAPSCGLLPYPRAADIAVTDALYGPYRDPAWYKWLRDQ